MTVHLTPEQRKLVDEQLESGRFSDEEAVLNAALDALRKQQRWEEEGLAEIREKLQHGYDQALRGELLDGPSAIAELRAEITELSESVGRR